MRLVWLCVALASVAGCRNTPRKQNPSPAPTRAAARTTTLAGALQRIEAADLAGHVERLASDAMRGRATPSPQLDEAADYIARSLAQAGVGPTPSGARRVETPCGPAGETAANVVGVLEGLSEGAVLVTAHYDHIGEADSGDDRIYNGANDNASGVAAMLEIADALGHAPTKPLRDIVFVAFCGEEHGMRGSREFVEAPPVPLRGVVAVLNLEMLGHPDPSDPRRAWVTGHAYSSLPSWLERAGASEEVTFVAGFQIGTEEGRAFDRSDNYPFAQAGMVAHTIAAGPIDEHYHAPSDEPSGVDAAAMVPIVRALARATFELANADEVPQWSTEAPDDFTRRASRSSDPSPRPRASIVSGR